MIDNRLSGDCDRISLLTLKGRDREIKIDDRVNRSEEGNQIDRMIDQGVQTAHQDSAIDATLRHSATTRHEIPNALMGY